MKCLFCQAENQATAKFCRNCGEILFQNCLHCQMELPVGARFCMNCGQPVMDRTPATESRYNDVSSAAPTQLVEKVRAAASLTGERRTVTALFVDIVGSTSLSKQLDTATYEALMEGFFDRSYSVIYRYEGSVARIVDDELLAFFGAPVAHEDDPVRAVHGALELMDSIREYSGEIHQKHGVKLEVRLNLSTGPVVIGPVGQDLKYDYSALGGEINLAARMEATKQPMRVLISDSTYQFIAPFFECIDLGDVTGEGVTKPVHMYQVLSPKAHPIKWRGFSGVESPLIGRVNELEALNSLSQAVQAGLGRIALVSGEAGLGKTRLITEWKMASEQSLGEPKIRWVVGHCHSYDQGHAYHLLKSLLRSLIGISSMADEPDIRAALLTLTREHFGSGEQDENGPSHLDVYPYLGHLLSIKLDEAAQERLRPLDPQGLQAQYQAALRRLLQAVALREPMVLLLEDLQWADPSSVEVLTRILPLASDTPIVFCLITRPNRDAPGWRLVIKGREAMGGRFTELRLNPLSDSECQELVTNILNSRSFPEQVCNLILERAEGNPYFVEELLRVLIERKAIIPKNGSWIAGADADKAHIPDNLHGLLLARIDSLPDQVKYILRVASVIGRQFPVSVLKQVTKNGLRESRIMEHLGTLETANLIRVAQVMPELSYIFQNTLVQTAAYGSLLEADQRKLHQVIGETLEKLYPERIASRELAPILGRHYYISGDSARAFRYYILAGDAALEAFANKEAEARYRRALELAGSPPGRVTVLFGLGRALYWQSRFEESIHFWREGIESCKNMESADNDMVARLYALSARAAWESGNTPESLRICQEGLAEVGDAMQSNGIAHLVHEAARAYLFNGLSREARQLCLQALEMARKLGNDEVQADSLATLGLFHDQKPEEALAVLTEAVQIANSANLLNQEARAHNNMAAILANNANDFLAAREHYQRSVELKRLMGSTAGELLSLGGSADVSLYLGDFAAVEAVFPLLRKLSKEVADPGPSVFHIRKIEALLLRYRGNLSEAAHQLNALQGEERQRGNLQNLIEVDCHLAETVLESHILSGSAEVEAWDEAERMLLEARKISGGGIGRKIWPCCLLSMIQSYKGNIEAANILLDEAREAVSPQTSAIDQGWLLITEARLAAAGQNWAEMMAACESACMLFEDLSMRWWRARILMEWARAYTSRAEPEDYKRARALLREASSLFSEMGVDNYRSIVEESLQALELDQTLAYQNVALEMAHAGKIQEDFLPEVVPDIPGWQLAATLDPARETSGDFYDFINLPGGRLGIVIADVADKGAAAALYMALSRTLIRTFAMENPENPGQVLSAASGRILADTPANLFVTAFYGILDPASGEFAYCNAGHNPPYLLRGGPELNAQALFRTGVPLGLFETKDWESKSVYLAPGDMLILYTDGVTDAQDDQGNFYEKERLLATAQSALGNSAKDIQAVLLADIYRFMRGAPQFDDITLVILTRDPDAGF
jgi:serine phosphatase RsbU (regulator of sigma subunit)/class 3 adenylate cyclase